MLQIDEEEIVKIITTFIREYVEKAGKKRVIIGLSGGIDSSVVLKLSVDALGKENVFSIFLPDISTPLHEFEHSRLMARITGANYKIMDISEIVHSIVGKNELDKITLGNIKARLRMIYLYRHANALNALVCGTSNKTELMLGYFTKYGDGGCDFMPIGDLYKTQVYQIARYLEIPEEIIKKPPTAGLWKGQTDEEEIGLPYDKIDKILYGIERRRKIDEIARIADVEIKDVERILDMVRKNEHKRKLPVVAKIGFKTVGIDWRYPLQYDI